MNEKERLLNVLNGAEKKSDLPCICPGGMMNAVVSELMQRCDIHWPEAHTDPQKMAQLAKAVYHHGLFENYGVPFCMTIEAEAFGAIVDMGDEKCEPHVVSYTLEDVSHYKKLPVLDTNKGRVSVVCEAIKLLKKDNKQVPVIGNITGPLSVVTSVIEPIGFYRCIRRKSEEVHEAMKLINRGLLDFALAQVEAGCDLITISDPSGSGEILGPKYFEELVVSSINEIIDGVRKVYPDFPFIVHICGQMRKVFPQLKKIHANAFSFDAVVSMKEAKRALSPKPIMGNVSTFGLELKNEEKAGALTRAAINSKSDIIAPACGLGMTTKIENIQAILKTVKQERRERQHD